MLEKIAKDRQSWFRWIAMVAAGGSIALILMPGLIGSERVSPASERAAPSPGVPIGWPGHADEIRGPSDPFERSDPSDPTDTTGLDAALPHDPATGPTASSDSRIAPDSDLSLPSFDEAAARTSRKPADAGLSGAFDCLIQSKQLVDVGSSLTGVIEKVYVERSDFVEAGQLLAELDSKVEAAAVEVARLRAEMKGDVGANEASVKLGKSKQERAQQLFEAAALSIDERDETLTEAELASFGLLRAREEKRLAVAELTRAQELLERRRIRSPIAGVVVDRMKLPGEVVKEETVMTVAQIDPLRAEVILPAAHFGRVSPGMRAEVLPELPDTGVHIATVEIVDRVIDAASGTFRVSLALPNPDRSLPSGLHCEARFLPSE